jgi:hypothetical protein
MIHSNRGGLRSVALSVALIGGAFAGVGVFSSQAFASSAATKSTTAVFTLNCNAGIASGNVTVTATNIYPVSVKHGTSFTIKFHSKTHVSGALAGAGYTLAPNGSEKGTVTSDTYLSSDATPSSANVAGTKGFKEYGKISSPSGFDVLTPASGTVTTTAFTAGPATGTDTVKAGGDVADVTIYKSNGAKVTTVHTVCTNVGSPTTIATIKVT